MNTCIVGWGYIWVRESNVLPEESTLTVKMTGGDTRCVWRSWGQNAWNDKKVQWVIWLPARTSLLVLLRSHSTRCFSLQTLNNILFKPQSLLCVNIFSVTEILSPSWSSWAASAWVYTLCCCHVSCCCFWFSPELRILSVTSALLMSTWVSLPLMSSQLLKTHMQID